VSADSASLQAGGAITQAAEGNLSVGTLETVSVGGLAFAGYSTVSQRWDAANAGGGGIDVRGGALTLGRINQVDGGDIAVSGDANIHFTDLVSTSGKVTLSASGTIAQSAT